MVTVIELKKKCKEKGIKGYSKLKKKSLVKLCLGEKSKSKKTKSKKTKSKKTKSKIGGPCNTNDDCARNKPCKNNKCISTSKKQPNKSKPKKSPLTNALLDKFEYDKDALIFSNPDKKKKKIKPHKSLIDIFKNKKLKRLTVHYIIAVYIGNIYNQIEKGIIPLSIFLKNKELLLDKNNSFIRNNKHDININNFDNILKKIYKDKITKYNIDKYIINYYFENKNKASLKKMIGIFMIHNISMIFDDEHLQSKFTHTYVYRNLFDVYNFKKLETLKEKALKILEDNQD